MDNKIYVADWNYAGNRVRLIFRDGSECYVSREQFENSRGLVFGATKDEIKQNFAVA